LLCNGVGGMRIKRGESKEKVLKVISAIKECRGGTGGKGAWGEFEKLFHMFFHTCSVNSKLRKKKKGPEAGGGGDKPSSNRSKKINVLENRIKAGEMRSKSVGGGT